MVQLDDRAATRRLLDRLGFGPLPGELAAARGFDATLDALLAPGPDPGVAATPPPALAPIPTSPRSDATDRAAEQQARQTGQAQLTTWWLDRMTATTAPLPERLVWFWHGHFATSAQKVREPAALLAQNQTFRTLGLGDFRTLAHAMVVDPAMMVWLDAAQNKVGAANENLAREFMELFALGVGNYAESDVREAARALTGYTVDRTDGDVRLVARRQDTGPKTIFGTTGPIDAPRFVDMVVDRPESARFVASRLWYRLVSSSTPPTPAVLGDLTDAYGPGTDVRGLLRALATSAPFRDSATTVVKQPVEWAVGLMRAVGVRASAVVAAPGGRPGRPRRDPLVTQLTALGQVPFRPPSVGGWPAGPAWLTPSAGLSRLALAEAVVAGSPLPPGPAGAAARIDWARQVLGVDAWSPRSLAALQQVAGEADPRRTLTVAALTPEYVVST
ncbi:DUF1800 domain-containing protein [Actinomycetospora chlora]|uniref:DUF1800 domain-containing protein n=1 Tax=Actinomycetospora chlora TaxID=663608 RepID=A0ABP9AYV5_9PSEU